MLRRTITTVKILFQPRWVKIAAGVIAVLGAYDLALSQFIPERWAQQVPRLYEIVIMGGGLLPWWGWLLLLQTVLMFSAIDYMVRRGAPQEGLTEGDIQKIAGAVVAPVTAQNAVLAAELRGSIKELEKRTKPARLLSQVHALEHQRELVQQMNTALESAWPQIKMEMKLPHGARQGETRWRLHLTQVVRTLETRVPGHSLATGSPRYDKNPGAKAEGEEEMPDEESRYEYRRLHEEYSRARGSLAQIAQKLTEDINSCRAQVYATGAWAVDGDEQ